jgi:hypothetical protein
MLYQAIKENLMAIQLGIKVKDRITGFMGIAIGRTVWLSGCVRVGVQNQKLNKDGQVLEAVWIDEQQLEVVGQKKFSERKPSGGPMSDPTRRADPSRS